jgi:hypothetical protein
MEAEMKPVPKSRRSIVVLASLVVAFVTLATLGAPRPVRADPPYYGPYPPAPAPSTYPPPAPYPPAPYAPTPPPGPSPDEQSRMEKATFSGKRLVLEVLAGALAGSVVGYATFGALCSPGDDCVGAAVAGWLANFAVTPLVVWQTGTWLDGKGTVGMTYLGASTALAPFSASCPADASPAETLDCIKLQFAVSTLLLPVTSAIFYELSSHLAVARWRQENALRLGLTPVMGRAGEVDGVYAAMSLRF